MTPRAAAPGPSRDNVPPADAQTAAPVSAAEWSHALGRFRTPSNRRAVVELAITLIPFVGCWILMYVALAHRAEWLYVPLLVLASGLLVRLFLIQHDCGHRAFFASKRANDWLGRAIGVLTLTPYEHWRRAHAVHHATHGNLDRRGVGDVDTLTVAEYLSRSRWSRLRYRLYRNPLVMFGIGPIYVFLVTNRIPAGFLRGGWRPWASTMGTNLGIAGVVLLMIHEVGLPAFLRVHAPIVLIAGVAGVWLFYVQHQFERTLWDKRETWSVRDGALHGSSHYDLPRVLRWFTANIGVHHVHHLASTIPYYRLRVVLRAYPALAAVNRLTLRQSFSCARLALWDERSRRMVGFRDLPTL